MKREEMATRYKPYSFVVQFDGALSVMARQTVENVRIQLKTEMYQLYMGDTLIIDHPLYPVPDEIQQPSDLYTHYPDIGDFDKTLVQGSVQLFFQRGRRLFAMMGVLDSPAAAGIGYPDPAGASAALTDGMTRISNVVSTAMSSI